MTTINTNIGAIAAQANMTRVNDDFNTAMTRLSTGLRINAAKDDAAGMAIGEKMTAQVMGLNQAIRNAQDGKNLVDTTEGAHVEVSSMLQRLRELAVQSSNDTNTASDRGSLMSEASQLVSEINRVAETTTFNGMKILDGSFKGKQMQIGADSGTTMNIDVESAKASDIGAHKVTSEASTSDFAAETLTISGNRGSEQVTTKGGESAKEIAALINAKTASTGVSATAQTNATLEGPKNAGGTGVASTVSMTINGVAIDAVSVAAETTENASTRLEGLRDAINQKTSQTGVSASIKDGEISLTANDGRDIEIDDFTSSTTGSSMKISTGDGAASATLSSGTTSVDIKGTVEFTSTNSFSVATDKAATAGAEVEDSTDTPTEDTLYDTVTAGTGDTSMFDTDGSLEARALLGTAAAAEGGSETMTTSQHFGSKLSAVSQIDLTTSEGAAEAIKVIDVALSKISESRADLGAVSNRLDSTISNLTNISTSVQAAKSQVMDADFAAESTALARGQILSQAATAMLAQANSSKQNVLSLLRG
ncbi:flagellar filament protein [Cereibacter sphaeroides]|uniref:flagellin N-terminal helical domain-containing protein n=1 Tax=Rhodobacterales TaxID=204455 RepID=UPI000BBE69C3|nr:MULTISPECIES: flagellin [Paracoccaceae]MCE6953000.1 flagellar filament protein [Cereibacter sphaeroides]